MLRTEEENRRNAGHARAPITTMYKDVTGRRRSEGGGCNCGATAGGMGFVYMRARARAARATPPADRPHVMLRVTRDAASGARLDHAAHWLAEEA